MKIIIMFLMLGVLTGSYASADDFCPMIGTTISRVQAEETVAHALALCATSRFETKLERAHCFSNVNNVDFALKILKLKILNYEDMRSAPESMRAIYFERVLVSRDEVVDSYSNLIRFFEQKRLSTEVVNVLNQQQAAFSGVRY